MGFPHAVFDVPEIPLLLLKLLFALVYINNAICCLLSWIGLVERVDLESQPSWQEFSEFPSAVSPVSAKFIRDKLSVITFRKFAERFSEIEEDMMCAVCLSSFEGDDQVRELCNCSHIFHRNCLDRWIDHHHETCPLCRSPLLSQRENLYTYAAANDEDWAPARISYLIDSS